MNHEFDRQANRNAALRWGGLVVGLLTLQVAGGAFAIYLATSDPSVAVVPDYHQKALNWDQQIELEQQARRLNWQVGLDVTHLASTTGLLVTLTDRGGQDVQLNRGILQLYHHARAGDVKRLPFGAGSTGLTPFVDCFDRDGIWQIELDLTDINGNRFVHSSEIVVSLSAPAEAS